TPEQSEQGPDVGTSSPAGSAVALLNLETGEFAYAIEATGFTSDVTAMHFHGPGGVGVGAGVALGIDALEFPSVGSAILTETQMNQLLRGQWYLNIHTDLHPGGEIRGQVVGGPDAVAATNLFLTTDQHEGGLNLEGASPSGTG